MVGCLQVQPVGTISLPVDVESQVGREQVPVFFDAAPAAVDPLRERLFLTVSAQAGLRQGSRVGAVLVEAIAAGAFSLAGLRPRTFVKSARRRRRLSTLCALGILLKRGGADEEIEKDTRSVAGRVAQRLRGRSQHSYPGGVHRQVVRVGPQHAARIGHRDAKPRWAQPPHPVSSPLARHFRRDGLSLAYRTLDQIEDGAKALRVFAGGHPGDQAVEHQVQVAHQYVAGDVVAHPSGLLLST